MWWTSCKYWLTKLKNCISVNANQWVRTRRQILGMRFFFNLKRSIISIWLHLSNKVNAAKNEIFFGTAIYALSRFFYIFSFLDVGFSFVCSQFVRSFLKYFQNSFSEVVRIVTKAFIERRMRWMDIWYKIPNVGKLYNVARSFF